MRGFIHVHVTVIIRGDAFVYTFSSVFIIESNRGKNRIQWSKKGIDSKAIKEQALASSTAFTIQK